MSRVCLDVLIKSDESGFACSKTKLVESGLPHLRPFNVSNDGRLDLSEVYEVPETEAPLGKIYLDAGDILFNNTNSAELVGKSALVQSPMRAGFSNHMNRIRLDTNQIEPAYFAFWLKRQRDTGFFTSQATQWVSQAAYKTSEMRKLEIDLPTLLEQRRIVDLLSRAEGIVRLRREAKKKATELIPALFLDMFGDPATNPKGWANTTFGTFGDCRLGKMLDKQKQSGDYQRPYLRNVNVQWDRIDTDDLLMMDFRPEEQSKFLVRSGDVLICEGGEIGRAAVWQGQIAECFYQKALHKLTPNLSKVRPDFVVWLLWHLANTGALLGSATHATIAHLTGVQLKGLNLICPPIELQVEFEKRVDACHSIQSQQSAATTKAKATFDALLAQAFSPSSS